MGNLETSKVKDKSADMNHIAASLGSRADNPGLINMAILEVCETLKVKEDFVGSNTIAAPIKSKVHNPWVNFGIIEMSGALGTKGDSIASGPNADDLEVGKMGVLEISETLKVKDGSAHINTITSPPGSTSDDPMGDIGNVEISETLEVINESTSSALHEDGETVKVIEDFTDINTTADDPRGNIGVVEISETSEVKNNNAASKSSYPIDKAKIDFVRVEEEE